MKKDGEFSLKVTGLPRFASSTDLQEVFEAAGCPPLTDVYVPGGDRGYGFLRFATEDDAIVALELHGLQLGNSELRCELSFSQKKSSAEMAAIQAPIAALPSRSSGAAPSAASRKGAGKNAGAAVTRSNVAKVAHTHAADAGYAGRASASEVSIHVGNLPDGATSEELEAVFLERGAQGISDVYIPRHGKFGFVRFPEASHAQAAFRNAKGLRLRGSHLELDIAAGQKVSDRLAAGSAAQASWSSALPVQQGRANRLPQSAAPGRMAVKPEPQHVVSVKVGNLPPGCSAEDLQAAFDQQGVASMSDVYVPRGKSFGFLRFARFEEAKSVLRRCHNTSIGPNLVTLELAEGAKKSSEDMAIRELAWMPDDPGPAPMPVAQLAAAPLQQHNRMPQVSVKVSNLFVGCTADDVAMAFQAHGVDFTTDVYVPRGKTFGFLRFARLAEARSVITDLNGSVLVGHDLVTMELAEGEKQSTENMVLRDMGVVPAGGHEGYIPTSEFMPNPQGEFSVKVSNLPPGTSVDDLIDAFAAHGIDSMTDVYIPKVRDFGFLRFASAAEAKYALKATVFIRRCPLVLEPAQGTKRSSEEMSHMDVAWQPQPPKQRPRAAPVASLPSRAAAPQAGRSPGSDQPSVRVANLPPGTSSEELQEAMISAGCTGEMTDVYVPKGDRGFGFVRFAFLGDAEQAASLDVLLGGEQCHLELATSQKKTAEQAAALAAGKGLGKGASVRRMSFR